MYYEEKIVRGRLMYRYTPDGKFKTVKGDRGAAVRSLLRLTIPERIKIFTLIQEVTK
jgi:hypothetical protein